MEALKFLSGLKSDVFVDICLQSTTSRISRPLTINKTLCHILSAILKWNTTSSTRGSPSNICVKRKINSPLGPLDWNSK